MRRDAQVLQIQWDLERLQETLQDMSRAASVRPQDRIQPLRDAALAEDQLRDVMLQLQSMRTAQTANRQLTDLLNLAEQLAVEQQDFQLKLRQTFGSGEADEKVAAQMAQAQAAMEREYLQLQTMLQDSINSLSGSQPDAAKQLRDALGQAQQNDIEQRMRQSEQYLRQGMGAYSVIREAPVTQALIQLRQMLEGIQQRLRLAPGQSQ